MKPRGVKETRSINLEERVKRRANLRLGRVREVGDRWRRHKRFSVRMTIVEVKN